MAEGWASVVTQEGQVTQEGEVALWSGQAGMAVAAALVVWGDAGEQVGLGGPLEGSRDQNSCRTAQTLGYRSMST